MINILYFIKQLLLKNIKQKSLIIFFLMSIFFYSCSNKKLTVNAVSQSEKLSEKDKENLTLFFDELLFIHGGAYTLFGDNKPVTIEPLLYYDAEDIEKISEYIKNHPDVEVIKTERHLEETWKDWKNLSGRYKMDNFIFKEIKLDKFSETESLLL